MEGMSFVKAMQDFFTRPPHGKKLEIVEFKALSDKDKEELRAELIREGYDVLPPMVASTS